MDISTDRVISLAVVLLSAGLCSPLVGQTSVDLVAQPYLLDTGLVSRSISFENPTGAPGEGGKAASKLGVGGRKGSPSRTVKPGETVTLCDIQGPGTIRHIWITTRGIPSNLRSLVIRGVVGRAGAPEHRMSGGRLLRHRPWDRQALCLGRPFGG